jgi:mRNA interferase RelE/StbE
MPPYQVEFTPAAERQLAKLTHSIRTMVAAAIVTLGSNPRPPGCVKLSGSDNLWRIRIRTCRVVYAISDARLIVTVVKIGDRKDVYRLR